MNRKKILGVFATGALLLSLPAKADNIFGEFKRIPDQIERGFSVGFDFGMLFIANQPAIRTAVSPGFNLAVTLGYDIFDYLSIEEITSVGINDADPNDPVLAGSIQSFGFALAAKGQYPLGRFYPFLEVGPGIYISRPSWEFPKKDKLMSILFGGGIEYYTYLRHTSLYLKGTYTYIRDIDPNLLVFSAGLKYTF